MTTLSSALMVFTAQDGGATLSLETEDRAVQTTGYWVGGAVPTVTLPVSADCDAFEAAVKEIGDAVEWSGYIGTWTDADIIYVDSAEWVADHTEAMKLASERGELAIWDIASMEELTTHYVG